MPRKLLGLSMMDGLYVYEGTNVCVYLSYQGRTIAAIPRPAGGCV